MLNTSSARRSPATASSNAARTADGSPPRTSKEKTVPIVSST
ncbi:hypothetical protein ACQPXT_08745 [Streptomyces sp. CA-100214]